MFISTAVSDIHSPASHVTEVRPSVARKYSSVPFSVVEVLHEHTCPFRCPFQTCALGAGCSFRRPFQTCTFACHRASTKRRLIFYECTTACSTECGHPTKRDQPSTTMNEHAQPSLNVVRQSREHEKTRANMNEPRYLAAARRGPPASPEADPAPRQQPPP